MSFLADHQSVVDSIVLLLQNLDSICIRKDSVIMPSVNYTDESAKSRPKPVVPPKPPMDTVHYSMSNIQDSPETDLDALLGELFALEAQLSSSAGDSLLLGLPSLPPFSESIQKVHSESPDPSQYSRQSIVSNLIGGHSSLPNATGRLIVQANDESQQQQQQQQQSSWDMRTGSPDTDSAFGDESSVLSTESTTQQSRNSNASSADSSRGSLNTPSPTQNGDSSHVVTLRPVVEDVIQEQQSDAAQNKTAKIKQALEKMKEANVKKLYVKFFTSDGGCRSLLVDERCSVLQMLDQLARKQRIELNCSWSIVEQYPDLMMERIYEDHELPVENILLWTCDSSNKLCFVEKASKYAFVKAPQDYLLAETSNGRQARMDEHQKRQLLEEFFGPEHVQPPAVEGWLYLKSDGRKSWKRHYFVLRASGLYYIPKGRSRSSKDLVSLTTLEMNQIYVGIGWRHKYKAPSDFGFAIKHPQIQVKASKYIKYLCAEDERSFERWMIALRIVKNGRQLFDNYGTLCSFLLDRREKTDDEVDGSEIRTRTNQSDGEIKLRPKSADVNCSRRNSGLVRVGLPSIPDHPLIQSSFVPPMNNGRGSGSQTPTSSNYSDEHVLVFDQEDTAYTGTIKKQPLSDLGSFVQSPRPRRQSLEEGDSVSSGKDSLEVDSDEEQFPPPPPTLCLKRAPPAPPRRSENTRLMWTPSPSSSSSSSSFSSTAKPDFQSELQLAMTKRLNKIETLQSTGDHHHPPFAPPKRVSVPPP